MLTRTVAILAKAFVSVFYIIPKHVTNSCSAILHLDIRCTRLRAQDPFSPSSTHRNQTRIKMKHYASNCMENMLTSNFCLAPSVCQAFRPSERSETKVLEHLNQYVDEVLKRSWTLTLYCLYLLYALVRILRILLL